jgi:hypothetical protein
MGDLYGQKLYLSTSPPPSHAHSFLTSPLLSYNHSREILPVDVWKRTSLGDLYGQKLYLSPSPPPFHAHSFLSGLCYLTTIA